MESGLTLRQAQKIIQQNCPAGYYASQYRWGELEYLPELCRTIEGLDPQPQSVCDVGPGWGTMATWLAAMGLDVTVVDRVPPGKWLTSELCDRYQIQFVQHDIEHSPPPGLPQFDLVLCNSVLPHLSWCPTRAVENIAALLKPDGTLLISALDWTIDVHAEARWMNWREVPEYQTAPPPDVSVKCAYTRESLEDLLRTAFADVTTWRPWWTTVAFGLVKKSIGAG